MTYEDTNKITVLYSKPSVIRGQIRGGSYVSVITFNGMITNLQVRDCTEQKCESAASQLAETLTNLPIDKLKAYVGPLVWDSW